MWTCARGRGRGRCSDRGGVVVFMLILLPSNPFFEKQKNVICPKMSSAHSTSKHSYWARVLDRDRGRGRGRGRDRGRGRGRGRGGYMSLGAVAVE